MFSYCPAVAVPLPVQCMTSPAARVVFGQETATPRLSVTWTLDRVVWPELVTTYSQSTGAPTWICGPGAVSASSPFVYFLMRMPEGCGCGSEEQPSELLAR